MLGDDSTFSVLILRNEGGGVIMDVVELSTVARRNQDEIRALEEKSGVNLKDC